MIFTHACFKIESPGGSVSAGLAIYDMERDYYMSAQEAKEYGLIDNVIRGRKNQDGTTLKISS